MQGRSNSHPNLLIPEGTHSIRVVHAPHKELPGREPAAADACAWAPRRAAMMPAHNWYT